MVAGGSHQYTGGKPHVRRRSREYQCVAGGQAAAGSAGGSTDDRGRRREGVGGRPWREREVKLEVKEMWKEIREVFIFIFIFILND